MSKNHCLSTCQPASLQNSPGQFPKHRLTTFSADTDRAILIQTQFNLLGIMNNLTSFVYFRALKRAEPEEFAASGFLELDVKLKPHRLVLIVDNEISTIARSSARKYTICTWFAHLNSRHSKLLYSAWCIYRCWFCLPLVFGRALTLCSSCCCFHRQLWEVVQVGISDDIVGKVPQVSKASTSGLCCSSNDWRLNWRAKCEERGEKCALRRQNRLPVVGAQIAIQIALAGCV